MGAALVIARDVLGLLRLEDGRPWVQAAHEFQREDALAVLDGERPYNFLTRSRGGSKTTDLSAVALSVLLAAEHRLRAYWLAADAGQGTLALDCIAGFVSRTATLEDRVEVQVRRVIVPATGATLEVLPADAPGAWAAAVACKPVRRRDRARAAGRGRSDRNGHPVLARP
jgi:hypothetical protein